MASQKFLQNPFLECQWSASRAKKSFSPSESIYLIIWAKFFGRNHQSTGKLFRKNKFLKILCIWFWWRDYFFPFLTLYWPPRNGLWRNFWEANYFDLKSLQHSVRVLNYVLPLGLGALLLCIATEYFMKFVLIFLPL